MRSWPYTRKADMVYMCIVLIGSSSFDASMQEASSHPEECHI